MRPRAGHRPHRESRVRRSPHLGTSAAAITTAVALMLAAGAAARSVAAGTVSLHVSTNGTVTGSPGHFTCAGTCSFRVRRGAIVTLRASARRHFVLTHWTGGCVGSAATCVLAVDRSTSVRAAFVGEDEEVALTIAGPGAVVSRPAGLDCGARHDDCTATFPWGTTVKLATAPATGGRFARWGGACANAGASACTLVVRGYADVSAAFGRAAPASDRQRLTVVLVGAGSGFHVVSSPPGIDCPTACETLFPPGTLVALTGNLGAAWSGDCHADAVARCSVIVDAPTKVVARPHFPQPPPPGYGVSVTVAGEGTVTAPGIKCGGRSGTLLDCENLFGSHATVVLTARPVKNARFAGWNQFCTGKKPRCTLHVAAPMTVGAVFRR